jgi:dynein heavy chain
MDDLEWRYILTGPTGDIKVEDNPTTWISENGWGEMYRQFYKMDDLEGLKGIKDYFMNNAEQFKELFDS